MARTVKDVRLDTRAARLRLAPRKKPYYRVIETAKAIGYYRGVRSGSWLGRAVSEGKYIEKKLGLADDVRDANEVDVLSFSAAQAAARAWFDELARAEYGGHVGPFSVGDACDLYLASYAAGGGKYGGKDIANTRSRIDRIKAALGDVEIRKLTTPRIKDWHRGISEAGPLTRSTAIDEATGRRLERAVDRADADAVRRRRASANRLLTVFKAALNHAFANQPEGVTILNRAAWEAVTPLKQANAPKVRYLTDSEAVRLLNASPPDFREIVAAALLTGCRYGELCRLQVRDFDQSANALRVEISKSGNPRTVALTDEGTALFARLAQGKSAGQLLLLRRDGEPWLASHQLRRMVEACESAKIEPAVSFHILRHTYGSRLAMNAAPMAVIAAQLGHTDTRMTERHYAHLGPSYVSGVVRSLLGTIGGDMPSSNVVSLRTADTS